MRAEIDVNGGAAGADDFERERMARLGELFPGEADAAGEFLGIHLRGDSGDEARGLKPRGGLDERVERIHARDDEELDGLAFFFGYLHDAATVLYPFSVEPMATLFRVLHGEPGQVADLGLPPDGLPRRVLERGGDAEDRVFELEAVPPSVLISWAMRELSGLLPRDAWLDPIAPSKKRSAP